MVITKTTSRRLVFLKVLWCQGLKAPLGTVITDNHDYGVPSPDPTDDDKQGDEMDMKLIWVTLLDFHHNLCFYLL